jgi:two-component system, LytTR family, sensor kinase
MTRGALILVYIVFFFLYFFGFSWMGNTNAGVPYPWYKALRPFSLTYYSYTLLTVLLAHFVVFRRYYYAKPRWKLAVALAGLLVFFILFRYLLEEIIMPLIVGEGNYNPSTTFRYYVIDNIYFGSIKIFIGFVFFLLDEIFRSQQQKAALLQQNKKTELNFLQAQMNPHFLFNSLNNIYSLAYEQHPQTAASVLQLSDMMRYVTYEKDKPARLKKELDYVKNLIDIQQLRHDYKLQVKIDVSAEAADCIVMPLLLIPLAENALKHGDLADAAFPMMIKATIKDKQLQLTVSNKKAMATNVPAGGVGLKNLRRRLELSFRPDEYSFDMEQTTEMYIANLIIPVA